MCTCIMRLHIRDNMSLNVLPLKIIALEIRIPREFAEFFVKGLCQMERYLHGGRFKLQHPF